MTLHQQPLPWARWCLLACRVLNLWWVCGQIGLKCDHMPEPKLGQRSSMGAWAVHKSPTAEHRAPALGALKAGNWQQPGQPAPAYLWQRVQQDAWENSGGSVYPTVLDLFLNACCLHCADAADGKIALITKSRLKSHSFGRRKLLSRITLKAWFTAQLSKCSYRLRGRDLSHRRRQAAYSRELETSWFVSVNKANTWWNCNQSSFTASCNSYSLPDTLHLDCGPFT